MKALNLKIEDMNKKLSELPEDTILELTVKELKDFLKLSVDITFSELKKN